MGLCSGLELRVEQHLVGVNLQHTPKTSYLHKPMSNPGTLEKRISRSQKCLSVVVLLVMFSARQQKQSPYTCFVIKGVVWKLLLTQATLCRQCFTALLLTGVEQFMFS